MRPHIFRGPLRAFQYVIMRVFLDVFSPLSGVVFLRSVFVILRRDFKCEFGHFHEFERLATAPKVVPTFCELVLVPNCFEIDGHTVNTVHTVDFEALLVIGGDAPQSGVHVLNA